MCEKIFISLSHTFTYYPYSKNKFKYCIVDMKNKTVFESMRFLLKKTLVIKTKCGRFQKSINKTPKIRLL
jgi:hypothetical protein